MNKLQQRLSEEPNSELQPIYKQTLSYIEKNAHSCVLESSPETQNYRNIARIMALSQSRPKPQFASQKEGNDLQLYETYSVLSKLVRRSPRVEWGEILNHSALKEELKDCLNTTHKGVLLFGPPGNGKSMLGKALGTSQGFFLDISSTQLANSSFTESLTALFHIALLKQPTVIFIDDIDKVLSDHHLTPFLLKKLDSLRSQDKVVLVGATNKVQNVSLQVKRRFTQRFHVPVPSLSEKYEYLRSQVLTGNSYAVSAHDLQEIAELTENYSYGDLLGLLRHVKYLSTSQSLHRPLVTKRLFHEALATQPATVSAVSLSFFMGWNNEYGRLNK